MPDAGMKAAILDELGTVPRVGEFDEPQASDATVVVEVLAAGMNPVEIALASGQFYMPVSVPFVVGREGVGRTADGMRGYFPATVAPFGSFAERALVPRTGLIELPDAIDDGTAVALGTAGLAAWIPFTRVARLREGESVLVLGASGAVGQIAAQAARALGAGRIVGAARSENGRTLTRELGADTAVGLSAEELGEAGPFDVVLDMFYGEPLLAALGAVALWGRVVQVGNAAAPEITLPAAALRSHAASITGYTTAHVSPQEVRASYLELVEHAVAGRITVEAERIRLDDVADAWRRQAESPHHKLLIIP